ATNQRIGALPQLAHTQRELAHSLRTRGAPRDREHATALTAEAAATAARLGLVALEERLAADAESPCTAVAVAGAAGPPSRHARVRHEGDVWTVACENEVTRLKDMKGVAYLLQLLRHPGEEFHALDLGGAGDVRTGDAGELLDVEARRAYTAR